MHLILCSQLLLPRSTLMAAAIECIDPSIAAHTEVYKSFPAIALLFGIVQIVCSTISFAIQLFKRSNFAYAGSTEISTHSNSRVPYEYKIPYSTAYSRHPAPCR